MISQTPGRGLLHEKLKDLLNLRTAVDQLRQKLAGEGNAETSLLPEEILGVFASCAADSQILRGCTLAHDGFTGFTPTQMTALRALMGCCSEMLVTVTIDPSVDPFSRIEEHELFAMSKRTIQSLNAMAGEMHAGPVKFVKMDKAWRFTQGSMLQTLEKRLMRYERGRKAPLPPETGKEDISLHISSGPEEEAQFAARAILNLVCREGYRFSQIAVIAGDLPSYEHHIERVFSACRIPFFIDQKQAPVLDPCLEFVRAALEIVSGHYSYEAVMRFLRTSLAGLERDEVDLLDLYLRAAMIRSGKRWKQEWTRTTRTIGEEELVLLNGSRERLIGKLSPFTDAFSGKAKSVKDYTAALKKLLETFEIEQQMEALSQSMKDTEGHPMLMSASEREARSEEYRTIYGEITKVLDEMVELIGQEQVSPAEYQQILEAGLDQIRIGKVPPGLEQVYVGDMLRTRLSGIRALIMVGLNDGWIPARKGKNGILSEMDRETLTELGIRLAPGMKEDAFIQRFYLYRCLTRPSERLYLSCLRSCAGSDMRPSYLMKEVTGLYPWLQIREEDEIGRQPGNLILPGPGMEQVARAMRLGIAGRKADPQLLELLRYVRSIEKNHRVRQMEQLARLRPGTEKLKEETAILLYGQVLEGSVTRMDQYALCPFMHFAGYGLNLKEREEGKITAADAGTLYHDVLERFAKTVTFDPRYDWFTLTREQQEAVLEECAAAAVLGENRDLYEDSARSRYVVERMKENLRSSVQAMVGQVQAGSFVPERFELPFRDRLIVEEGLQVELAGKIDRLDLYRSEEGIWMKVLDYKSGSTRFDLPLMYDGRQLQLLAYLNRARKALEEETGERILPAGIYYMHLTEPRPVGITPDKILSPEEVEQKLLDQLKPDGLTVSDPRALNLFAADEQVRKHVVPVPRYTKEGDIRGDSPSATARQMEALEHMCLDRIRSFALQIRRGTIRPLPYKEKQSIACDYCRFRMACPYDIKLPGAAWREKTVKGRQEMLEQIAREEEEQDG